ncbi:Polyferredoxin NapH (periplasmic nitrate reductase) [hydrothermal vent metagenome]|uniref:Polyferredoxin NapH (Periplasmic nitrate reductase) n=1 Tax=hydrothermal vent metagenome TaxID=652676 RepID=A0A3B1BN52_9ZZZZ
MKAKLKPFFLWRHLNKLRWLVLSLVLLMLIALPFVHVYQTYVASFSYDLLDPTEKELFDIMETLTSPITDNPADELDAIKGNTWSGHFFGYQISDPLAVVGQTAASLSVYWPFVLTALLPVIFTLLFGRFYCGWICPATFLYELNTIAALTLQRFGIRTGHRHFDRRLKYGVLLVGVVLSAISGSVLLSVIYPPAIVGRELYFGIALGGAGAGLVFFVLTLLFDLLVSRRGFCRYLCPGGALYSLLGRFRLFRIRRIVENCNDCAKCNAVCEFGLDPLHDDFGQECNNCTACIAVCPTDALTFVTRLRDDENQGPGHLGKKYKRLQSGAE